MTPYQRFIHLSRYARWIPSENRRETWEETVTRYFDFFRMKLERDNSFTMKDSEWGYLASAVKEMAVMPAMRCLMTAGEALDRDNTSGYNCSALLVDSPSSFDAAAFILLCGTGVGFSVERQFVNKLPTVPNSLIKTTSTIRVEDSKEGWAYAIRELITMLYAGRIPTWDLSQVRPSGARLKTFGGRASGPEPLDRLLHNIVRVFTGAKGRKLRSIECHDIMCYIGESVVVGGVRRSATISLSNLSDERMRAAKSGSWWNTDPQRSLANNSVAYTERPDMTQFFEEWIALFQSKSGERGIFNRYGTIQDIVARGRRNPVRPDGGYFDYLTNPCGEIILRPDQFCNLSEVVARDLDSKADFLEKARLAAILGTMQSTLDSFGYLKDVGQWTANVKEERLLGVSITGILDSPLLVGDTGSILREGRDLVIGSNKEWANKLGINPSVATTCIKPSGTVSQLVDASSGIHPRWSPHYIRRVRSDIKDPLTTYMMEQGFPHEQDQFNPQNIVFSFPIKSPESGSIFRGAMTAVDQLELWKKVKDNFCEHNPSTTIYVRDDEWMEVGAWVYKRLDAVGGLSFLPYSDHVYQQAPYEEVSKEAYDHLATQIPTVDFSDYTEWDDNTVGSQEYACVGGSCDVA